MQRVRQNINIEINITMSGTKIGVSEAAESIPGVYVNLKWSIFGFYP